MNVRQIKVKQFTETPRKGRKHKPQPVVKPQLVLTGLWLMEAGILPGDIVSIEIHKDRLVIY